MKFSVKNLFKFRNIVFILLILLIVIIGYNAFVYLKIFEGAYVPNRISEIVISPLAGTSEWLNIAKITLTDIDGKNIMYTATSSNGYWPYKYGEWWLKPEKLYDSSDSPQAMFHSGQPGCTLTITPTDTSQILSTITIRNRRDCCQERLKNFKLTLKSGDSIVQVIELKNVVNLIDPAKGGKEDIVIIPRQQPQVVTQTQVVTKDVPVNNTNNNSIQKS